MRGAGGSYLGVGYLLAHDALATLLANFSVDKAQDAVVHVQRVLPLESRTLLLLQGEPSAQLLADVRVLEFEFGRQLLRFHGSEWGRAYLGRGALISLSSVSPSKLHLEMVLVVENMRVLL